MTHFNALKTNKMKISYNWLKEYVDINVTPEELAEALTMHSFEVENIIYQGKGLDNVVVGEVLEKEKHPNADKLSVVKVKISETEILEIVCGAPNIDMGQKVLVALVGAKLPKGMVIEKRKVRGVESCGMVCAEDELGLGNDHNGIMVLNNDLKIGIGAKEALGLDDVIFEIDILPNRAHDCLSHIGAAREIAAITNEKLKTKNEKLKTKNLKSNELLKIKIEDESLCRRYSAAVVNNIEIKDSPNWLKSRLESCGVRSINNIVDITNYAMLALGQPMHAFDFDKLKTKNEKLKTNFKDKLKEITIRLAKEGESILALDGKTYKLDESDLVIADKEKPIAIAGVMGGLETAVDENTKNIIFESANFQGAGIRKTSQRLKLASESSYRFEREIDPELTIKALGMAVNLTKELANGDVSEEIVDIYPSPVKNREIEFDFSRIEKFVGIKIEKEKAKKILQSLQFEVFENGEKLKVTIPTFRIDVEKVNDVIEEIARIYGYENIPESNALIEMKSVVQNKDLKMEKNIKRIFEGMGFAEVYNYSFVGEKDIKGINLLTNNHLELQNPLSEELKFMRTSLLSGLINNARENLKHKDKFQLFEVGRVYLKSDESGIAKRLHSSEAETMEPADMLPNEKKILAGIAVDKNEKNNLFYEIKGQAEKLLNKLGFNKLSFAEIDNVESFWHKGRSAEIFSENKSIGRIGEIHPGILNYFGIESRAGYFEFDLENLFALGDDHKKYKQINKFPEIKPDLSVVFDESVKWADIEKAVIKTDNALIKDVEPFDIYRGKGLGENKKSIAFRITYQAEDGTLKDEEVNVVQNKIIKALEKLGGEIRK